MAHSFLVRCESNGPRSRRKLFAWSLLAGLWLVAALAGPFFAGRIYTRDDLGAFHLPVRAFYAGQLARGEPFDWMPQIYSGFYLTGEGQVGAYHPWHLLLYRCLPFHAALAWEWLSAYPCLLAGTWFFLRRLFRRRDAAMVGSLLFTFSSFSVLHFVHPNAVAIVAHIPWLLWAIDIVLVESSRRRVAAAQAAIALLTGSQLLLGYPQYVWFSLLAEASYAGFLLASRRRAPREDCIARASCSECVGCSSSAWPRLLIAKCAGALLGGVQLLPTFDALCESTRQSADSAFTTLGSLHPMNLVQLVAPYLFTNRVLGGNTHELSVYIGAVPLMLVAWVAIRRHDLGPRRPLVRAAGWLAGASLVMALGDYGQVYRLQQYLPLVGRFRCPCRYLVLFQLSMAVIATVGFLLVQRAGRRRPAGSRRLSACARTKTSGASREQIEALWSVVFLSAAVALAGVLLQGRPLIASVPKVLAGPLLMAAAAGLVTAAARGVRGALAALIVFAAADLGCYGLSYGVYVETDRLDQFVASVNTPPGGATVSAANAGDMPAQRLAGRVFAPPVEIDGTRLWIGNQMTLAGWCRTDGYTGLEPRRQLDYFRLPALRVAATRWVRRDSATAAIDGLVPRGDQWLEVPDPLPRVRLVTQAVASDCPARDIEHIDIKRAALCEHPVALPPGDAGRARIAAERPGRIEIETECALPQLLVVAESFHPGWRCTVGGVPRPVQRVNGDFLGCPVGPGDPPVVLEFHPDSLERGWLATISGAGLVLCCFLVGLRRRTSRSLEKQSLGP